MVPSLLVVPSMLSSCQCLLLLSFWGVSLDFENFSPHTQARAWVGAGFQTSASFKGRAGAFRTSNSTVDRIAENKGGTRTVKPK